MAIGLSKLQRKNSAEKNEVETNKTSVRPWQSEDRTPDLLEVILNRQDNRDEHHEKRKIPRQREEVVLGELETRIKNRASEIFKNLNLKD